IDETFAAQLASGVTRTCLCWRLMRADGIVVGVTDHDRTLLFRDTLYEPGDALEAGELTASPELRPGQAGVRGALSSDAISEEDLAAGLWDGARIDVFRFDWEHPQHGVQIWSGRFSEITRGELGFEAELVSLKADLERPVGRIFSSRCGAVLGDTRCGVNLDDPSFSGLNCDQRFDTCKSRFQNTDNFRGFPHMPGTDAVLAGPAASGNTGGRR
ncbi:MAG: DUF2163 domain-containing protein, partial [Pseudomonadota bacterium]